MNLTLRKEVAAIVVFLILATVAIAMSGADLAISSCFFIDGQWPIGEQFPWNMLYRIDRIPAVLLAVAGLLAAAISLRLPAWRHWIRQGAFLVLLLALGPGLMVNVIFKDHWGRPRPRDIVQFGGKQEFLQPWQMGINGKGRSFPSGHGSAAFYMTAPYFIYRRSRKRLAYTWLAGGLFFGILMSIARIAQGGHFLSDNLWAWGMVHLCAVTLYYLMGLDRE
ncbi:MAG: phosphatase PAP2 family protein [Pedobacter sp.]